MFRNLLPQPTRRRFERFHSSSYPIQERHRLVVGVRPRSSRGGLPLVIANIALPLLLGVGVAFKIYYTMAWRAGKTGMLQSTLTRAVIFSAMTNAIAFGSMAVSSYPGMSSMGKLMALALSCALAAAVLFQPVLMGRPRQLEVHPDPIGHQCQRKNARYDNCCGIPDSSTARAIGYDRCRGQFAPVKFVAER